jgi:hypothetical protein
MGERSLDSSRPTALLWAAQYHFDVTELLNRSFLASDAPPVVNFPGFPPPGGQVRPADYTEETNRRSSLAILVLIEASFRVDYRYRCENRLKDPLSRAFRDKYKRKQERVGLENEVFDAWGKYESGSRKLIGDLRGAFRFRHWLAHGSYWLPKLGRGYDFNYLYLLADRVFSSLTLLGMEDA